jgi:hypothetical protein
VVGKCPVCKGNVSAFDRTFICQNNRKDGGSCSFGFWRNGLEKLGKANITDSEAIKLIAGEQIKVQLKKGAKKYTAAANLEKGEKGYFVKVDFGGKK